ncbi:poly-beta-hydroxybutyrate polymerase N-terminal domain-containing protein [Cupriavidus sp. CV2]|uniref:PHA/PHB synthase family protein n=1 Tax=Cupriavidus ulmosensis TaxID=3065913 RepID=UPI00296A9559|nr:alpha/beta fold hydrolase [Cupriavidus sp. CV2]MDW3687967.1 poly-beta-hydroxybutyrate polymerase N-terminal domain-containing protein [Cupriavidus sp. CV2]
MQKARRSTVVSAHGRATGGVSPAALSLAWLDWAWHLAGSPGKQVALFQRIAQPWPVDLAGRPTPLAEDDDPRFANPDWHRWPFQLLRDTSLQAEAFLQDVITNVRGVSPHHERVVSFAARQWTDMLSPSNCWWLNPEVLRAVAETGGRNFLEGGRHWLDDQQEILAGHVPRTSRRRCAPHCVGRDVAITPGKVIYRNALIELIQYTWQTATVWHEPVLIVPSWLLKYYVLDLSPHNSLVRYLVARGHTVFLISWKNPREEARDLGMNDYLELGLFDALAQVRRIIGAIPVHAAGYCLGGTLLAIGAAALGRDIDPKSAPLKTVTLFAAQTDFSEPGELGLFIDASELAYLDALMWEQGYLDGTQMASAFQLLHSRDLIWSRLMREYLLGEHTEPTDLMAWNADTTRLPYRMHSENLQWLYLHNDLAEGRYCAKGRPVVLADLKQPIFVVGTERDHVSPWRSVYKLHLLTSSEISFLLTSGGHNAGIVSEPGHAGRRYRFSTRPKDGPYLSPNEWFAMTPVCEGSWWPCWQQWLAAHSSEQSAPPALGDGTVLDDAPGTYVLAP